MDCLRVVTLYVPEADREFGDAVLTFLESFGTRSGDSVAFHLSRTDFVPRMEFSLSEAPGAFVDFDLGDHHIEIPITNTSGREKQSPEIYEAIEFDLFVKRIGSSKCERLDHVGFNLPWFGGVHPEIARLRSALAERSAYYRFPTGEEWDFILPATKDEITGGDIDLAVARYPKLEIVSFEKSSTPMIQFDFSIGRTFLEIVSMFPEGIVDTELKNVWVYIKNPYGIDLCFVVGENQKGDWSEFFAGHRL